MHGKFKFSDNQGNKEARRGGGRSRGEKIKNLMKMKFGNGSNETKKERVINSTYHFVGRLQNSSYILVNYFNI